MKTAIYIEDGKSQLVITPETNFEKDAVKNFQENRLNVTIYRGSFYDCQGGWTRHCEDDDSIILSIKDRTEAK